MSNFNPLKLWSLIIELCQSDSWNRQTRIIRTEPTSAGARHGTRTPRRSFQASLPQGVERHINVSIYTLGYTPCRSTPESIDRHSVRAMCRSTHPMYRSTHGTTVEFPRWDMCRSTHVVYRSTHPPRGQFLEPFSNRSARFESRRPTQVVYTECTYPKSTFGLRIINKTRVFNNIRISRLESRLTRF